MSALPVVVSRQALIARKHFARRHGLALAAVFTDDAAEEAITRANNHARRCAWEASEQRDAKKRAQLLRAALHHVADARRVLRTMSGLLIDKGGRACVIDSDQRARLRDAIEWAAEYVHDVRTRRHAPAAPAADAGAVLPDLRGRVLLHDRDSLVSELSRKRLNCWRHPSRRTCDALLARILPTFPQDRDNLDDYMTKRVILMTREELAQLVGLLERSRHYVTRTITAAHYRQQLKRFRPVSMQDAASRPSKRRSFAQKCADAAAEREPRQLELFPALVHRPGVRTVYLVACAQQKTATAQPAAYLYQSPWFKKARRHVLEHMGPRDGWLILSALHEVVHPTEKVAPYDLSLATMTADQRRAWGRRVVDTLSATLPRGVHLVVLAGGHYREALRPLFEGRRVSFPLAGLGIGQQLQWFDQHTAQAAGPVLAAA